MLTVYANSFDRLWAECEQDYLAAVSRVGASGWYILGHEVEEFEKGLSGFCESRVVAVACASGLDAIEIALRVSGVEPGDKVLTSPLSAFATSLAIIRAGARPIFCDVDSHGLMDPEAASAEFARNPDIHAIIPVHLYGHIADMEALSALASDFGVPLIEDAAQAIGARRGALRVGELADAACFSFYPTKNLGALGDGGALILSDIAKAEAARCVRNYGQSSRFAHDVMGMNSRLDELHAATLTTAFLPRLVCWLSRRRLIASQYLEEIQNRSVTLLPGPDPDGAAWHLFPVLVPPSRRQHFLSHLAEHGVQGGLHYPVLISDQKAFIDRFGTCENSQLKMARRFTEEEVSLPINPFLTKPEVGHVIATVNAWSG